jgi:hypothetical protein
VIKLGERRVLESEYDDYPIRYHGHVRAIEIERKVSDEPNPKQAISDNTESLDLLITLLSHTDKRYAILAWNLLSRLPTNESIKAELRSLEKVGVASDWNTVLDPTSFHKLLYYLIIAEELAEGEDGEEWLATFCEKGGPAHLHHTFMSITLDTEIDSQLLEKYLSVQLNLLLHVFKTSMPTAGSSGTATLFQFDIAALFNKIMQSVLLVATVSADADHNELTSEVLVKTAKSMKGLVCLLA